MKQHIDIPTRDRNVKVWLEFVDGEMYKFYTNTDYMTEQLNEDGTINFIDPCGGFPIGKGCIYDEQVVKEVIFDKVVNSYLVIFEKNESEN